MQNLNAQFLRLSHLLAASRLGSLTAAAAQLGLTQPALTRSIRALEETLGLPVLTRTPRGVVPTEAGEALIAQAQVIEQALQAARQDIERIRDSRHEKLVIGCGPSEATRLLPAALALLHQRVPGVRTTVLYGLNEALMPMVRAGEIEFALSSVPRTASAPDLVHEPILVDSAAVIARTGHPLAGRRQVKPADLLGARWILARRQELERRALDELLLNAGLRPVEAEIETTSAVLMKSVVISSDLLTFLPRELIHWEERAGQLCALPVAAPQWARSVGVSRLRQRRPGAPALALIEALRAVTKRSR